MRLIRLVAGRELRETFRSRAYWVTMGLVLTAVAAAAVVPRLVDTDPLRTIGVAGDLPAGLEGDLSGIASGAEMRLEVRNLGAPDEARRGVSDGDVDAALVFGGGGTTLVRETTTSARLLAVARQAAVVAAARERLVDEGLDPRTAREALATPPPREEILDDEQRGRTNVAFVVSFALYLSLLIGGMGVATGVAVEKSSRIAELLMTTLRPGHLLAGKVLGIGAATLVLLVVGAAPFAGLVLTGAVGVPRVAVLDVVGGVGWFLLGFGIYATGFAALGALVDRQEDLGATVGPMSGALVLSILAAVHAQTAPGGILAVVTSILPVSAPMVMPVRVAAGSATAVEVIAAVAVGVATLALLIQVGGLIYRRALLRGGRRLRVREVLSGRA